MVVNMVNGRLGSGRVMTDVMVSVRAGLRKDSVMVVVYPSFGVLVGDDVAVPVNVPTQIQSS